MREMAGLPAMAPLDGEFDLLETIMRPEGMKHQNNGQFPTADTLKDSAPASPISAANPILRLYPCLSRPVGENANFSKSSSLIIVSKQYVKDPC